MECWGVGTGAPIRTKGSFSNWCGQVRTGARGLGRGWGICRSYAQVTGEFALALPIHQTEEVRTPQEGNTSWGTLGYTTPRHTTPTTGVQCKSSATSEVGLKQS